VLEEFWSPPSVEGDVVLPVVEFVDMVVEFKAKLVEFCGTNGFDSPSVLEYQ